MRTAEIMVAVCSAALIVGACKGKDKDAGGGGSATASGSAAATGGGSGTASAGGPRAVIAVDEDAVRKLVDAWLAAQNSGDFAAYQALYAPKLEGVKRVGARTWRYDRAGWLADRQRMFKHPMTVTARDLVIKGSNIAATVELVQTFSQGKFKDEGPKHLVLVKGPSGFQIAREEMLRSDVGGSAAAGNASAYAVMQIDDASYVVVTGDAKPAWGDGILTGPFDDDHQLALMKAPTAPSASAWLGRALTLYDDAGRACTAKVTGLSMVSGGTPHFGEVQVWTGDPAMSDDGRVWTPAERADAVWAMGTPYLVAAVESSGDCQKPVVAVDATSTPAIYAKTTLAQADHDAAVAAFRKLPGYKAIQKDWKENWDGQDDWVATPTVAAYSGGGRTFVVVEGKEGDGCGDFSGALSVIFEQAGGKLVPLPGPDGVMSVKLVLDSDGDGAVEIAGTIDDFRMVAGLYEASAKGMDPVIEVSFPNNDCGC